MMKIRFFLVKVVPQGVHVARGFTLLEMLMSISVMTVLSTILIYKYPETTVRLNLANNNQTISLLLREAQIRGSAVESLNSSLAGYGVFFNMATPRDIVLFGDTIIDPNVAGPNGLPIGDGLFSTSTLIKETKATTTFAVGYIVSKICVGTAFPFTCTADNVPPITSLVVSFTRPNPQPSIYINNNAALGNFSAACIEVRSPKAPQAGFTQPVGHIRSVQVYNSGMIRTATTKCDNSP